MPMIHNYLKDTTWIPWLMYYYRVLSKPRIASRSRKYWEDLHNKYKDRRGFVVGNGPSLCIPDLDRIQNDICIASNRIYLAYPDTAWRPLMVTCIDTLVWKKFAKEMCEYADPVVVNSRLSPSLGDSSRIVHFRNLGPAFKSAEKFSVDTRKGLYSGSTVTFANLQIAIHLGLNPIYLIGCDHYYKGEEKDELKKVNQKLVAHQGGSNHFHPNYRAPGEKVFAAPIKKMEEAYQIARDEAERHGIKIYNATRGGHLEIFERADFDEVVG